MILFIIYHIEIKKIFLGEINWWHLIFRFRNFHVNLSTISSLIKKALTISNNFRNFLKVLKLYEVCHSNIGPFFVNLVYCSFLKNISFENPYIRFFSQKYFRSKNILSAENVFKAFNTSADIHKFIWI